MRTVLVVIIAGSLLLALVALFGTSEPREDDLSRSIARMVVTAR